MQMLRLAAGVTRLDRVRNDHIIASLRVCDIGEKIEEYRLRWLRHIRRKDGHITQKIKQSGVVGKAKKGGSKNTDCHKDLRRLGAAEEVAKEGMN